MTENVSDPVLEGNSVVTLLQELFACEYNRRPNAMRGMRFHRRCRLFASARGSNGSSSKMFPLRWHSHAGGSYTAWPVARNERRALS